MRKFTLFHVLVLQFALSSAVNSAEGSKCAKPQIETIRATIEFAMEGQTGRSSFISIQKPLPVLVLDHVHELDCYLNTRALPPWDGTFSLVSRSHIDQLAETKGRAVFLMVSDVVLFEDTEAVISLSPVVIRFEKGKAWWLGCTYEIRLKRIGESWSFVAVKGGLCS